MNIATGIETLSHVFQIIICITVIITTGVWLYLFRFFLKQNVVLHDRINYLDAKIRVMEEPCYRGSNDF